MSQDVVVWGEDMNEHDEEGGEGRTGGALRMLQKTVIVCRQDCERHELTHTPCPAWCSL